MPSELGQAHHVPRAYWDRSMPFNDLAGRHSDHNGRARRRPIAKIVGECTVLNSKD